jgi:cell division protein FtsL
MINRWFYTTAVAVSLTVSFVIVVLGFWAILAMQHGITELEESYAQQHKPQEHNDR